MDNFEKIMLAFVGLLLALLLLMISMMAIHQSEAKQCVRKGGEPYYFITSFECKENINVNLNGE